MLQATPLLHQSFAVGDCTLTQLSDGLVEHGPGHSYFGVNVGHSTFCRLSRSEHLSTETFSFPATISCLDIAGERVLIDAGHGSAGSPNAGHLLRALEQADIPPDSISQIFLSHLHGDHVGGLLDGEGRAVFGQAKHWVHPAELAYWRSPASGPGVGCNVRRVLDALGEGISAFPPLKGLVPGLSVVESPGHTPGHVCFLVESAGERLFIAGDLANHPVWSVRRPRWHMSLDVDPVMAADSRARHLAFVADEGIAFAGYHMPFPAVGRIVREGSGFRYVPS